jgi:hypothetical protein
LATYPPEQELSRGDVLADGIDLPEPDVTPSPPVLSATPIPARDLLHVEVISVETVEGRITVRLRIYNGQPDAVPLGPEDFSIAFGYAPQPPGPWTPADGLEPFALLSGQAVDLTLLWAWGGEAYASFEVGVHRFAIEIR